MPQLAALYKKYEAEGFHIVGLECQNSTEAEIKSMVSSKSAGYQITTGSRLAGADVSGLPHGFLFDANGNAVDTDVKIDGKFEPRIKDLMKDIAGALAGPGPYKKLAPLVAQMKAGLPAGSVLKTLQPKLTSKDADEAAEAKLMSDTLRENGNAVIERAAAQKSEDPANAAAQLDKIALQYAGDEIGTKAKTESDAIKKDPALKKEIDAAAMWKKIEAMDEALKPVRGVKNPKDDAFKKANLPGITAMMGGCTQLIKLYPGTKAAKDAQDLIDEYK